MMTADVLNRGWHSMHSRMLDTSNQQTSTSSNHTESLVRRAQARQSLSAKLKTRTTGGSDKPTVLYSKRKNNINPMTGISSPKNVMPQSGSCAGQKPVGLPQNQTKEADCHGAHDMPRHKSMAGVQQGLLSKHQTLSNTDIFRRSSNQLPNISSASRSHPNMKITRDTRHGFDKDLTISGNNLTANSYHSNRHKHDIYSETYKLRFSGKGDLLPRVSSRHMDPVSASTLPLSKHILASSQCLKQLDRTRIKSADKTRQWIMMNPLGPEPNEDFEYYAQEDTFQIKQISSDTQTESEQPKIKINNNKRVRFRSDEWLVHDDSCMF